LVPEQHKLIGTVRASDLIVKLMSAIVYLKKESLIPKLAAVIMDLTFVGNAVISAVHRQKKRCAFQGKHEVMNQERGVI
jgi:hypothetical protein